MKIPVDITVNTTRVDFRDIASGDRNMPRTTSDSHRGVLEFTCKGKTSSEYTISYKEEVGEGVEEGMTVMYKDGVALISRCSEISTNFVFNPIRSCDCVYGGDKQFTFRIKTMLLESTVCKLGGKLNIEYTVEMLGNVAEKTSISISVCPVEMAS